MSRRAQTTLDFAIGVSLFAAVLLFVFIFVPGLLSPFTVGVNEETVASNRVADSIVGGQLGTPEEPGNLDTSCTSWFFEHAGDPEEVSPSDCRYDGETVQERLGLGEHQFVNVTIIGNTTDAVAGSTILCVTDDGELHERGSGSCSGSDVVLAAGPSAPERNADTIASQRVAALGTEDVTVRVELW